MYVYTLYRFNCHHCVLALCYTASRSNAINAAAIPPLIGKVNSQDKMIFLNRLQSTFSFDRKRPTNTIDPTLQCVLLIGRPKLEATNTVNAAPISMQNPLQ